MARDLEGNVVGGECLRKLNVQLFSPGFYESKDHVDEFTGGAVAPVVALQSDQHLRMSYGSIDCQDYLTLEKLATRQYQRHSNCRCQGKPYEEPYATHVTCQNPIIANLIILT